MSEKVSVFQKLDELSETKRILFRRAAGKMLNDVDADCIISFYQIIPQYVNAKDENKYFFAFCIHCLWDQNVCRMAMQKAVAELRIKEDTTASLQKRFTDILDTEWTDDGYFAIKLLRLVRILKNKGYAIDGEELLKSLMEWNKPSKVEQKKWARVFASNEINEGEY